MFSSLRRALFFSTFFRLVELIVFFFCVLDIPNPYSTCEPIQFGLSEPMPVSQTRAFRDSAEIHQVDVLQTREIQNSP